MSTPFKYQVKRSELRKYIEHYRSNNGSNEIRIVQLDPAIQKWIKQI